MRLRLKKKGKAFEFSLGEMVKLRMGDDGILRHWYEEPGPRPTGHLVVTKIDYRAGQVTVQAVD